jgi:apolipoprotein N-acyltransferase
MIRATNTGVSAVIDPWGRVTDRLPQFEVGSLSAEVRGREGWTPYGRWGNHATVLLGLGMLLLAWLLHRRVRA